MIKHSDMKMYILLAGTPGGNGVSFTLNNGLAVAHAYTIL
jgi:hypothetical protein